MLVACYKNEFSDTKINFQEVKLTVKMKVKMKF